MIVPLDIATGDVVTPYPISYKYTSLFYESKINIHAYNLETMIAEKLETVYSKDIINSRSKDFYDLYILYKLKYEDIDYGNLKKACIATFQYRKTKYDLNDILETITRISNDKTMNERWDTYRNKNIYAQSITFEEVNNVLGDIIKILNKD